MGRGLRLLWKNGGEGKGRRTFRRSTVATRLLARSRSATIMSTSASFATTSWSDAGRHVSKKARKGGGEGELTLPLAVIQQLCLIGLVRHAEVAQLGFGQGDLALEVLFAAGA